MKNSNSLPIAGLRNYFAGQIRNRRIAIRRFPVTSTVKLLQKERMQAELSAIIFTVRDIVYFSENPETLS